MDIRADLRFKEKTIHDLARFISTRAENVPNYTLLLGAGCSISSGIRSASELIKEWRREIIGPLVSTSGVPTEEEITKYLANTHLPWFDKNKEYSSLFERRFDLQPQRRIFVENEVASKKPSIGYAYLAALVNQSYFNTVFTTNFDDLLNEAFFQFSDLRPIICAHDSSINGVSVTSKRPKIIKLHGDYLFDDIKATARETESLEQNMRLKFAEFSKDSGLVVVGYAGNDRSVMDVLTTLLRNEDYFKKGIYWCLRSDSEISEELRKLLWKDRVYFVNIDGFDELFAELFCKFNDGDIIPISTRKISSRQHDLIKMLIDGKNLENSNSEVLRRAFAALSKESTTNALYGLLRKAKDEDKVGVGTGLTDDELLTVLEASNLMEENKNSAAIELCRNKLRETENVESRVALLNTIVKAHRYMGDYPGALGAANEISHLKPYSARHHLSKLHLMPEKAAREKIIEAAEEVNPHYEMVYLEKARIITEEIDVSYGAVRDDLLSKAVKCLEMGIEKNPSADNPCWIEKFNLLDYLPDRKERDAERKKLVEQLTKQSPIGFFVLKMKAAIINEKSTHQEAEEFFGELGDAIKRHSDFNPDLEIIKIKTLASLNRIDELRVAIDSKTSKLELDSDYKISVAKIERQKFLNDERAIELLEMTLDLHRDVDALLPLINALIDIGKIPEAEKIFLKWSHRLPVDVKICLKADILIAKKEYDSALSELDSSHAGGMVLKYDVNYIRLLKGSYKEVEKTLRDKLEKISFSVAAEVEIINFELAKKMAGGKINDGRINSLLSFTSSATVKVAAHALLKNKDRVVEFMEEALRADQSVRFQMNNWPVLSELKTEKAIATMLESGVKYLNIPPRLLQMVG